MNRKSSLVVLLLSLLVVSYVVAGVVLRQEHTDGGPYRQLGVYTEVLQRISADYVTEPDLNKVTDGALHGLLESLDADSSYLSPAEYKAYLAAASHPAASLGLAISKRQGYGSVVDVVPGGPAARTGIMRGDYLEAVAGRSTRDMSATQIRSMFYGAPGSTLELSVIHLPRGAEPQKISVTRSVVPPAPLSQQVFDGQIGYIKVPDFAAGRSTQIAGLIRSLTAHGAQKLLLDLRDSGSGSYAEAVATANLFLDHGTITTLSGQTYPKVTSVADPSKLVTRAPLSVLVNYGTAGPAEIVAAALMENGRASVVGEKTYGVGAIQKLIEVGDGSAVLLSIAKYHTPTGKLIAETGVTPNVLQVQHAGPSTDADLAPDLPEDSKEDYQLKRALETLGAPHTTATSMAPTPVNRVSRNTVPA
ncbi:MAG: S41 family peptidase [Terriglobales bacterium]